jgi:hypothetical protein
MSTKSRRLYHYIREAVSRDRPFSISPQPASRLSPCRYMEFSPCFLGHGGFVAASTHGGHPRPLDGALEPGAPNGMASSPWFIRSLGRLRRARLDRQANIVTGACRGAPRDPRRCGLAAFAGRLWRCRAFKSLIRHEARRSRPIWRRMVFECRICHTGDEPKVLRRGLGALL